MNTPGLIVTPFLIDRRCDSPLIGIIEPTGSLGREEGIFLKTLEIRLMLGKWWSAGRLQPPLPRIRGRGPGCGVFVPRRWSRSKTPHPGPLPASGAWEKVGHPPDQQRASTKKPPYPGARAGLRGLRSQTLVEVENPSPRPSPHKRGEGEGRSSTRSITCVHEKTPGRGRPGAGGTSTSRSGEKRHKVKWKVFVRSRQSHQARVWVPPSILAKPRWPDWRTRLGLSIGMITS